jgi:hypothetical protein
MRCEDARRELLEADIDEMQEGTMSPLSLHLDACARCRALAAEIRAFDDVMRADYAALVPGRTTDEAARLAYVAPKVPGRRRVAAQRRRGVLIASALGIPLAAALLIFAVNADQPLERETTAPPASLEPVAVEVPPDQNAIVFATRNPSITVVWLYPGEAP